MKLKNAIKALKYSLMTAFVAGVATSCDLMHDSRKDCPEGLFIHFVYDYNIHRADIFKDHVGEVTAYIFDQDGRFVKQQTESNAANNNALTAYSYLMHVSDLEPGDYQVIALAQQKSQAEIDATGGAKYHRT